MTEPQYTYGGFTYEAVTVVVRGGSVPGPRHLTLELEPGDAEAPEWQAFEAGRSDPVELSARRNYLRRRLRVVVRVAGFEPAASRSQGASSDQTELHPESLGRGRSDFMACRL